MFTIVYQGIHNIPWTGKLTTDSAIRRVIPKPCYSFSWQFFSNPMVSLVLLVNVVIFLVKVTFQLIVCCCPSPFWVVNKCLGVATLLKQWPETSDPDFSRVNCLVPAASGALRCAEALRAKIMLLVGGLASQKQHQTWEVYPETMASLHVFASFCNFTNSIGNVGRKLRLAHRSFKGSWYHIVNMMKGTSRKLSIVASNIFQFQLIRTGH